ncbi:DUF1028 domain-containing protein [Aureitalea sp. L0-47]|uniref:DUF1028 domain-containing protein n=1 Tax=Aureitalea sp. L0-47 TaxID=2816962 RepID=UPI0022388D69|nr:DUF1028 domain-containing protein [Aureitalea sp. L0-47]MCW5519780.1 DUF1028 domain-containing protein [Aureitalea sp. L0-47]
MKKFYTTILSLLLLGSVSAQDTFSIIAVDPATGEVGSAGASCVTGVGAGGIIDIITDIIPGRGGINSQAYVCIPNINLQNGITRMDMGDSPTEVIDWLVNNDACSSQNFDPAFRQYGVADFDEMGNPRTAGYTGNMTDAYTEDRQGATYSIQGNILLNQTVIDNMEDNFNNTSGTLADKLMAALQGANIPGADSRCLGAGTSSTTAYLLVYKEDDLPGQPYLRLNVGQQPSGTEPIDILQGLYDDFLANEDNTLQNKLKLYPNPAKETITLESIPGVELNSIEIFDLNGKLIQSLDLSNTSDLLVELNISSYDSGVYFVKVNSPEGVSSMKFVKQ